jgi:NADH:ubiquinone oxidoreductase subunit D
VALGRLLEHADEFTPDDLALFLRIGNAGQGIHELIARVDPLDPDPEMLGEGRHDLVAFLVAQQAGIDKDAQQLITDRLVQQRCHDRGVDPAGQAQQHGVACPPVRAPGRSGLR